MSASCAISFFASAGMTTRQQRGPSVSSSSTTKSSVVKGHYDSSHHQLHRRSRGNVSAAAAAGGGGRFDASEMELTPPGSRESSFEQAREAIGAVVAKRAKKSGKTRKKSGKALQQLRVAVELPLASDTPTAVCAMVVGACGGGMVGTAVYGDDAAAAQGAAAAKGDKGGIKEHVTLQQALSGVEFCDLQRGDGAVALVGIGEDQIASARKVADLSGGRPVVGVNVEWEHAGDGGVTWKNTRSTPDDAAAAAPSPDDVFANSFSVVYSYLPLAIQGLMGATQEGAVFKCVRGGAPEGSPWRILVKDDGGTYQQVGAMQRRPEQADLENAMYNAAAAKSPVNKSIGVFRGLADKIPNPLDMMGGGGKK